MHNFTQLDYNGMGVIFGHRDWEYPELFMVDKPSKVGRND